MHVIEHYFHLASEYKYETRRLHKSDSTCAVYISKCTDFKEIRTRYAVLGNTMMYTTSRIRFSVNR